MRYQPGDKVLPINKTTGCPLEKSNIWNDAQEKKQNFLYVSRYSKSENAYILVARMNGEGGDYFLEKDLMPYVDGLQGAEDL